MRVEYDNDCSLANIDFSTQWPSEGKIVIDELRVKYSPNLGFALKDVTVSIPAGAKVRNSVVVRTVVVLLATGVVIGAANTLCKRLRLKICN